MSEPKDDYGRCPHCGAACEWRERRLGGNDGCENGHVYPSAAAVRESGDGPTPGTLKRVTEATHG